MKKMLVGLICLMLAAGSFSGCKSKKTELDENQQDTSGETVNEHKIEEIKPEEIPEEEKKDSEEAEDAKSGEEIMQEDLTMKVLKNQSGGIDYTSLEELEPKPGTRIAVVAKNTKTGFWVTVKKGMDAAVKDLNEKMGYKGEDKIKLSFEGPAVETDVEKQINVIDTVLSENPSVLCLAAIDMESCEAQIEAAVENEIPVVVLDSKVESELVTTVCATDNYAAGAEAARKLAESIGDAGQIAIMAHVGSTETSVSRENGFVDEIKANHPEIEIVNISHENEETSMADMADAVMKLYPDVKGYYCTNEIAANDVLSVVKNSGKNILVVGFDAGKKQIEAVKNGTEFGLIAQNPYGMGYATVVAGIREMQGLSNEGFINTGYQWIDSESLDLPEYKNYLYE